MNENDNTKGCWENAAAGGSVKICSTNDGTHFVSKADCETSPA